MIKILTAENAESTEKINIICKEKMLIAKFVRLTRCRICDPNAKIAKKDFINKKQEKLDFKRNLLK